MSNKCYMIYYISNYDNVVVDDIVYAANKVEAIKIFIVRTKGRYFVHSVEEVNGDKN